jgi:integrase
MPQKGYHRKSNGEGSIFQRSDGRWCAQIQPEGTKKPKYFYGTKYKSVKEKLENYKQTLLQPNHSSNNNKITVDEFITNWLINVKSNDLKPTSYDRLERTINNQIIPAIGQYSLSQLSSQQIQNELINPLKNDKSYSTIKKAYNAINACYKYAISIRQVTYNPVDAVIIPSITQFKKKEIYWFNDNEIKQFKTECTLKYYTGSYKHILGYGMIFVLNTGLRLGEIIAIKWNDIDLNKKQLHVNHNAVIIKDRSKNHTTKHKLLNQDFLKTKSSKRIIPLNNTAIDALDHIKKIRYFGKNSYILCTKSGKQVTTQNFSRQFKCIIKNAKITDCGVHTLRHTFASQLFKKGIDIKTISALLGHANISVTYNTYIHLIQQQKIDAVKSIEEI